MLRRYDELFRWVKMTRPQSIVEIGAWRGVHGVRMIRSAQEFHPNVSYTGFDLFEEASSASDELELNGKDRVRYADVDAYMREACPDAKIRLVKGNTRRTIVKPLVADFAYIDGGHSVETIASDYRACRNSAVVVLDDYYMDIPGAPPVDTTRFGCNSLIAGLLAEGDPDLAIGFFPVRDRIEGFAYITMAFVVRLNVQTSATRDQQRACASPLYSRDPGLQSGFQPLGKDELIAAAYRGLLGRAPDQGGAALWRDRLETRLPEHMILDFINTDEFQRRYRSLLSRRLRADQRDDHAGERRLA